MLSAIAEGLPRVFQLDAELWRIVLLSLEVSPSGVLLATLLGLPLGAVLAVKRFPGRRGAIVTLNALMGLPPVVVGLLVYLLLSRAGPLGELGLLFTPGAMIIAQTILILPIIAALARQALEDAWREYEEQLRSLGAQGMQAALTLLWDARFSLITAVLAGLGQPIIAGVSLSIEAGPSSIILGANGAGKSVLMRLMHGLLAPSAGSVRWNEADSASVRRRQAMVFQRPVMLRRSALANVIYALALAGVPDAEREGQALAALDEVGLRHLAHRPARVLSGGEQQRLALARAWALHPEVLFLDEPTASLDPGATREIETVIKAFDAAGTKIVMATHNLGQGRRLGDEVIYLQAGRVMERAPIEEFFARPPTAAAAPFMKGEVPWV